MAVNQINHAIHALGRIPSARGVPRGHSLVVCRATQEAWNAFVESDDQALHSTHMLWLNGEIVVVEFGGRGQSEFTRALHDGITAIPHVRHYMAAHGSTPTRSHANGILYQADESYGPKRLRLEPLGVQLPVNVAYWYEFMTLKVEVGLSRGFCGDRTPTSLDYKAMHVWSSVPGVAYVLCIAIDDHDLTSATYKLYELTSPGLCHQIVPSPTTFIPTATPIQEPHTVVALDARRLLGLAPGMELPPLFPDPVEIDLFQVLQAARVNAGI